MAKIFGLEIKNRKSFKNAAEKTCYCGDIYYQNKKYGFWSMDYTNGTDIYEFEHTVLDEVVMKFQRKFFGDCSVNLDTVLKFLSDFMNTEEIAEMLFEEGYKSVIVVTEGKHYICVGADSDPENALKEYGDRIRESSLFLTANKKVYANAFGTTQDFIIE